MNNQIALVTGVSHERGIGAAICQKLAMAGLNIFFTHWKSAPEWPDRFKNEIQELGVQCQSLEVDLSQSDSSGMLLDSVTDQLGFPTILVNNAAHSERDGYMVLDVRTLDDHYAVNMRSTFLLCVEFARRFKHAKKSAGRIINMTSGQGLGPMPGELAYSATKGAISAFTLSLYLNLLH